MSKMVFHPIVLRWAALDDTGTPTGATGVLTAMAPVNPRWPTFAAWQATRPTATRKTYL